jgi:hypothetical protein
MRITIKYEASWRNSFLDGSNNEPVPMKGRKFVSSIDALKKTDEQGRYSNFKIRNVTIDTVMGILNRLIGDQRKLYKSRQSPNYFFAELEEKVSFNDREDQGSSLNKEMIYLRNITPDNFDRNSFTGMIKASDPIFNSDFSKSFWGVLNLDIENLREFIENPDYQVNNKAQYDPLSVLKRFEEVNKLKPIDFELVKNAVEVLQKKFDDASYKIIKGKIKPIELYCSALYLQVDRLHVNDKVLTKKGCITGISKCGFTAKDFMDKYTTGSKKPVWGNPYLLKEKRKGEGEVVSLLTKANGTLDINLDIPEAKAQQLKEMIEAAGVSSFYLGKKGLAYVDVIR